MKRILSALLVLALLLSFAPTAFAVNATHWAQSALDSCVGYGVLLGDGGGLRPDDEVTRAEFAAMTNRAFGYGSLSVPPSDMDDFDTSDWFYHDLNTALALGYIEGVSDTEAAPNEPLTREMAALMLYRVLRLSPVDETVAYSDFADVSAWAAEAVTALTAAGYLQGYGGAFHPQKYLTRAEAATLLSNIFGIIIDSEWNADGAELGNVTIRTAGAYLANAIVAGDLFITEGVGDGDVYLDNVWITGRLLLKGGGENSIHVRNLTVGQNVVVDKPSTVSAQPVRFRAIQTNNTTVVFEGKAREVIITDDVTVLIDADNEKTVFNMFAPENPDQKPQLVVNENAKIDKLVVDKAAEIKGFGAVDNIEIKVPEVTIDRDIKKEKVEVEKDVDAQIGDETVTGEGIEAPTTIKQPEPMPEPPPPAPQPVPKPLPTPEPSVEPSVEPSPEPSVEPSVEPSPSPSPTWTPPPPPPTVAATGVTLDNATLTLTVGESDTLAATVLPNNASNKTVTWSSDNTAVATVANGTVTAIAVGTATITVTTHNGRTADCVVTVNPATLTLAPSGSLTLSPVDTSGTINVTVSGLIGTDTITIGIASGNGLSVSNNTDKTNGATTITITYDGTTAVETPTVNPALTISDSNYTLSGSPTATVTVYDGQAAARAIPVTQTNVMVFNTYARTDGLTRHYKQTEDIVLTSGSANWTAIGTGSGRFTGTYDGGEYTIENLTINASPEFQGMFGYINGGLVKNVGLVSVNISGTHYVGGVVGYNDGTVQNCYVTGDVTGSGSYVGGVVGSNRANRTVSNCYSTGNVSSTGTIAGGVVGHNYSGTISNCYSTSNVSSGDYAGGVVGHNISGTVKNCIALTQSVTITSNTTNVGRVVGGKNGGTLTNNYAWNGMTVKKNTSETVTPTSDAGGRDGESLTALAVKTQDAWTAANFDFTNVWTWTDGFMPSLHDEQIPWPDYFDPNYGMDGSVGKEFKVYNVETLSHVGKPTNGGDYDNWTVTAHYEQIANIDMTAQSWTPIGSFTGVGNPPGTPFTGSYDGGSLTISNLAISNATPGAYGLFGFVYSGTVKNLGLVDVTITGAGGVAGIVAVNAGTVDNCTVSGALSLTGIIPGMGGAVGGIVAYNNGGTVRECYSAATVSSSYAANSTDNEAYIGGVVGAVQNNGTVSDCYSSGNVSGYWYVGGVAGIVSNIGGTGAGTIQNCYATGDVSGTGESVGGILGENVGGAVENCMALNENVTTAADITLIGRVVGDNNATLTNNYAWSGMTVKKNTSETVTPTSDAGGKDGADVTATELKTQDAWETAGFDFNDVWTWNDSGTFMPSLHGEQTPWPTYLATPPVSQGSGTVNDPFLVYDVETLSRIGKGDGIYATWNPNAHYKQIADIDLSGVENWQPFGTESNPLKGTYDGGGYTISNLTFTSGPYAGLFGYLHQNGVVRNVRLVNANITADAYCAALVGQNEGLVENCAVINATVNGYKDTGAVVGCNGGQAIVRNCYSTGTITRTGSSSYFGGVVGCNYGLIENCYSTATVSGNSIAGGIAGGEWNYSKSRIENCVALNDAVNVTSSSSGRITGATNGTRSNNYARSDMLIGKVGSESAVTSSDLTGINGADVEAATYNTQDFWQTTMGWDFTDIWEWDNGTGLPKLKTPVATSGGSGGGGGDGPLAQ